MKNLKKLALSIILIAATSIAAMLYFGDTIVSLMILIFSAISTVVIGIAIYQTNPSSDVVSDAKVIVLLMCAVAVLVSPGLFVGNTILLIVCLSYYGFFGSVVLRTIVNTSK